MDLMKTSVDDSSNAAVTDAEAEVTTNLGTFVAIVKSRLQNTTNGDAFSLVALTEQLVADAKAGVASTLQITGSTTQVAPAVAAAPGLTPGTGSTNSDNSTTEPSEAEKLGQKIIALFGDDLTKARQGVQFMGDAFGHDMKMLTYMQQVLYTLTRDNYPDKLVELSTGLVTLKSLQDEAARMNELDETRKVFERLVDDTTGSFIVNESSQEAASRVRKEVSELKTKASASVSDDTFLRAVEAASGVKPVDGETFESYMTRVIVEVNKKAGVGDDAKFYDELKKATGIDPVKGENLETYIDRIRVKLIADATDPNGTSVTKLLDEIGTALGVKREGKKNADYKTVLLAEVGSFMSDSENFRKHYDKLVEIANVNGIAVDPNESPIRLAVRIIKHNRRVGSPIKGV